MKSTSFQTKPKLPVIAALAGAVIFALPFKGAAQSYVVNNTIADAFLASGSPGNPAGADLTANNYGGAGTLAISSASSTKGEFDSVIMFATSNAVSAFNTTYGAGNWTITGLTLSLASNTGTQGAVPSNNLFNNVSGGSFGIDWLLDNAWVEGAGTPSSPSSTGVNFDSISTLLAGSDSLGTYTYTPPGNNVYASYNLPLNANLLSEATAGGNVSLYFYAADSSVSYLFNSRSFSSGHPELTIDVTPTPEPATLSLMVLSLSGILWFGARKRKSCATR
jgi:hypothetical protein